MTEGYEKLLERIIEFESLVNLAITRKDSPAALPAMIEKKWKELSALMEKRGTGASAIHVDKQPVKTPILEEKVKAVEEKTQVLAEKPQTSEIKLKTPEKKHSEIPVMNRKKSPAVEPGPFYALEDDDDDEETVVYKAVKNSEESTSRSKRPSISLNDKFLFIRELFNGQLAEYEMALDKISGFAGYTQAEKYFIEQLGWSQDNETAARFLEIVKSYFTSKVRY